MNFPIFVSEGKRENFHPFGRWDVNYEIFPARHMLQGICSDIYRRGEPEHVNDNIQPVTLSLT